MQYSQTIPRIRFIHNDDIAVNINGKITKFEKEIATIFSEGNQCLRISSSRTCNSDFNDSFWKQKDMEQQARKIFLFKIL